jgi:hypothetical protein
VRPEVTVVRFTRPVGAVLLRIIAAAGLAVDAGVHADLAPLYDGVRATISEGELFRIEAAFACLAALGVLLVLRRAAFVFSLLVALSALGALFLSRYVDLGGLGPIPSLYEPSWDPQKTLAAAAEIAAATASLGLLFWPSIATGRKT